MITSWMSRVRFPSHEQPLPLPVHSTVKWVVNQWQSRNEIVDWTSKQKGEHEDWSHLSFSLSLYLSIVIISCITWWIYNLWSLWHAATYSRASNYQYLDVLYIKHWSSWMLKYDNYFMKYFVTRIPYISSHVLRS